LPEANRKVRRLIFDLISKANVVPRPLYITNASGSDADHNPIGARGFAHVLKGKYEGEAVALKMPDNFNKGQEDVSPFSLLLDKLIIQCSYFQSRPELGCSTMPQVAQIPLPSLLGNSMSSTSASPATPVNLPPSLATSLLETFRSALATLREVSYTLSKH